MFDGVLTPALAPFSIAIGVMLLIAITEAAGTLFGISPSGLIDQMIPEADVDLGLEADADGDLPDGAEPGVLSALLGWLCVGQVPLLVLFVALLTTFGLAGFAVQTGTKALIGGHAPLLVAVPLAIGLALPPTRWLALGLGRLMPKEETDAVSSDTFVGKVAVIIRGVATRGVPAEAKLRDAKGQMHYVLVEPDSDDGSLPSGSEVLLVSQMSAIRFTAIENGNELLSETHN